MLPERVGFHRTPEAVFLFWGQETARFENGEPPAVTFWKRGTAGDSPFSNLASSKRFIEGNEKKC